MSAKLIESVRRGDWIQTYTGRKFWPLDAKPEDVDIADIAHALSHLNRFTGHTQPGTYSVAQHSVLVSRVVRKEIALPALLHDAAEAYMGDISRPLKRDLYAKVGDDFLHVKTMEAELLSVIFDGLGVPLPDDAVWAEIERADMTLLATEARDLMGPLQPEWSSWLTGWEPTKEKINPWYPGPTKDTFLMTYRQLKQS